MKQDCNETFFDEIVKVEVYRPSDYTIAIPFSVPNLLNARGTKVGDPLMTVDYGASGEQDGVIDLAPTLKITSSAQVAGHIYQHDFQLTITEGFENIKEAVNNLQGTDFNVVLTMADATKRLCYSLPQTPTIAIEEQLSSARTMTVKIKLKSRSSAILLSESV